MKRLTDQLLDEVVGRLVAEFAPDSIILFGSHAWGTPNEDSDVDLLVIVPESDEPPHRRAFRGHRCLRGLPISKDLIVKTRREFEKYADVSASLSRRILEEGVVLYDAGKGKVRGRLAQEVRA